MNYNLIPFYHFIGSNLATTGLRSISMAPTCSSSLALSFQYFKFLVSSSLHYPSYSSPSSSSAAIIIVIVVFPWPIHYPSYYSSSSSSSAASSNLIFAFF